MIRRPLLAIAGLAVLVLAACSREEAAPKPDSPVAAIEGLAQSLRENDLVAFSKLSVPPSLYAQMQARWEARQASQPEPSAEERAEVERMLTKLTAPGAEQALYSELEPTLVKFESEMAAQMPLMVAMGSGFVSASIQNNETLSEQQKKHAGEVVGALTGWATTLPVADREKARQATTIVVETARALDIEDAEQLRNLGFEQTLEKGGIVMGGGKRIAALYGLDADSILDSVQATPVSEQGDQAVVKVEYTLLGKPVSFHLDMVRQEGGWYSADALASAQEQLAEDEGESEDFEAEYETDAGAE